MSSYATFYSVDLSVVATLEAKDRQAAAGDRITLDYVVRNGGPDEVDDPVIGFYLSTDALFSDDDIFLEAEESSDLEGFESDDENEQVPLPGSLAAGDYFVLVVADPFDQVPELSEDNNVSAEPITIGRKAPEPPPTLTTIGEAGVVSQSQRQGAFYNLSFTSEYINPVLVMPTLSFNGPQPTTLRVRNLESEGAEFQIDEWDYLDGNHVAEDIPYLVVEEGVHKLPDGRTVEAGFIDADASFSTVAFTANFSFDPVVFTQVVSTNNARALTTRQRGVTESGFQVTLQAQESFRGTLSAERVAWVAISPGVGSANGQAYLIDQTSDAVTSRWYTISFDRSLSDPAVVLAAMQTTNGRDPATVRYRNLTSDGVQVKIEEEQSADQETSHTTEVVGYATFPPGPLRVLSSVNTRQAAESMVLPSTKLSSYPNPFRNQTVVSYTLPEASPVQLTVYTLQGQVVTYLIDEVQPAGTYQIPWVANSSSDRVFLYRLTTRWGQQTHRLLRRP